MKKIILSFYFFVFALTAISNPLSNTVPSKIPSLFLNSTSPLPGTIQAYTWHNNEWKLSSKSNFTYNAAGLDTEIITYSYENDTWNLVSRIVNEYNDQDKVLKTITYSPQSQPQTSNLKNGNVWVKLSEIRYTYDSKGTLIKEEEFLYNNGIEFQFSGTLDTPTYDTSNRIIENWRQKYYPGQGWKINQKNEFVWNTANELVEISILLYNHIDLSPPPIEENWELSLKYVCNSWVAFEASEFLPLFEEENVETSIPNPVIIYDYSTNTSGEQVRRIEGTFINNQKDITISHFDDPNWINDTLITSIYDDRDNLIEEIGSKWEENTWAAFSKNKNIYNYIEATLADIVYQKWDFDASQYVNESKLEFLYMTTGDELAELNKNLVVYPNPSSSDINIKANQGQVTIYTAAGQLTYEHKITSPSSIINISDLSKGIYFVKWHNNSNKKTIKLVIQ